MIKVACISCQHPYELDERRLPATGLKMRCPKCGTTFVVFPDARVESAPQKQTMLGGMAAPPKPAAPIAAPPKVAPPPVAVGDIDLPAPRGAMPKPAAPALSLDELDLPAPRGAKPAAPLPPKPAAPAAKPAAPAAKPAAPAIDDELDLPAPRGMKPPPAPSDLDLDLPAPRGARPVAPPAAKGPPPRAPLAPPFAPAAAPAAAARPMDDLDLDLPSARKPAGAPSSLDIDLPAPRKPAGASSGLELDLPALRGSKARPTPSPDLDIDLPAPRQPGGAKGGRPQSVKPALADDSRNPFDDLEGGGLELDLPTPGGGAKKGIELDLDLPAPRGKADGGGGSGLELDLPSPKRPAPAGRVLAAADQAFGDLDLPVPKRSGMEIADLPGARDAADLPAPRGAADLPAPRSGIDLPAPRGAADLPAAKPFADLPAPRGASDLPAPRPHADLPAARGMADLPRLGGSDGNFSDLDLPPPRKTPASRSALDGDLDLPPPRAKGAKASVSEFELPVPEARTGGGSRGHGEIDLPDASRDDMEFADIPQERQTSSPAAARAPVKDRASVPAGRDKKAAPAPRRSRGVIVTLVLILLLAGGGAALSLTPYGPFGLFAIEDYLAAGDPGVVAAAIQHADELALRDTPTDYQAALTELANARNGAGRNRALLARSLLHESLYQVRFGTETSATSRAAGIKARIEERDRNDPSVALGLAADALRAGDRARASSLLATARAHDADDPFVDLLDGEIALAEERFADAPTAFESAEAHHGGAAARWGLARARATGEDLAPYDAALAGVLELSPGHVDALLARARRLLAQGDDEQAITLANQVVGVEPAGDAILVSYTALRARAWTFLGGIYEARGHTQRALDAYGEAVHADTSDPFARLGEGRMLLADRPSDALTRFETVLNAPSSADAVLPDGRPVSVAARLGAARAMTQLDRVQEAHAALEALATERPDDADVQLWLGRVEEELEHPDPATMHYRESIRLAPTVFEGYLALARLYDSQERSADAVAVLETARGAVVETAQMHEEIGTYALSRSRLPEAEREFLRALELDASLPAARFGLGVTLRRSGRIDEAAAAFEELGEIDPGHPGLALERGQLFEARGEADRAVEFYRQALEQRPDDPDLMLRLGAALVAAEEYDEAEQMLTDVQREDPGSAEAEHFIGRIAFARGRFPEAQQHFDRAISLDSNRGEYFMWAGRAALEANNLGTAMSRADEALEKDGSLGDAYYVRGMARLQSGAVRDAQRDLERAIELNPTRIEALAGLGRCHDEQRHHSEAIAAYERAVAARDTNGLWWYRLGLLLLDASRTADSVHALSRATVIGEAEVPRPAWLADAHRVQGDGLRLSGQRAGAIEHYQRYLEIAPTTAIDRRDVRSALMDMGVVPGGD